MATQTHRESDIVFSNNKRDALAKIRKRECCGALRHMAGGMPVWG